jgi:hypothetical protein
MVRIEQGKFVEFAHARSKTIAIKTGQRLF